MAFAVPWESLAGGVLLGISALTMLLINGKVAGISGILTGLLTPKTKDFAWRLMFVMGMVSGGFLAVVFLGGPGDRHDWHVKWLVGCRWLAGRHRYALR